MLSLVEFYVFIYEVVSQPRFIQGFPKLGAGVSQFYDQVWGRDCHTEGLKEHEEIAKCE